MTRASWLPLFVAGLFGLVCSLFVLGRAALDPTNVTWLLHRDWATHFLGWAFFRLESWRFPLGSVLGLTHPVGTVVGNTDSLPWVAVLFKTVSVFLPAEFQYIGPWLALCFVLQGIVGTWTVRRFSADPWLCVLAGMLFVMSPVLLARLGHPALSSHWLILAMIGLYLAPRAAPGDRARLLIVSFGLTILSAGINPYLAMMVLALAVAVVVRLWWYDRVLCFLHGAAFVLGSVAAVGLVFFLFGLIGGDMPLAGWGFGSYSADLLTFVNPMGASWLLPPLPLGPQQYEGFAYFGTGMLFVIVSACAIVLWRWPTVGVRRYMPLLLMCSLLALFALSHTITMLGEPILDLRRLYNWRLDLIWGAFRSSGRFVWPLYYVIMVLTLGVISRRMPKRAALVLLILALVVQAPDLGKFRFGGRPDNATPLLQDPAWTLAKGNYRHLVLYPPQIHGVRGCDTASIYSDFDYYVPFAYQAVGLGLTINSGYLARPNVVALSRYCGELAAEVARGPVAADTIYVVSPRDVSEFKARGMICGRLDGYDVCVAAWNPTSFARRLDGN